MREFTKVMCVVVLMFCGVWAAMVWSDNRPDSLTKVLRYVLPAVCVLAIIGFMAIHFRMDEVPDYLHELAGRYFDRDGFCFSLATGKENGVCVFRVLFQNRRDSPCVGRIMLRPGKDFISTAKIDEIGFEIDCPPAGFGIGSVPAPIAKAYQGKQQRFEIGASVEHPSGKGRTLRFRNGILLRHNTDFKSKVITGIQVAGALTGSIIRYKPAVTKLLLPIEVSETVPDNSRPVVRTFWKLGDPEIAMSDLVTKLKETDPSFD